MEVIIDNIIMIGFGLSLLMSINHMVREKRVLRDYLFFVLFLALGITQLAMWNVNIDLTLKYPHLTELDQAVIFIFGPLLYLIYKNIMDASFRFVKQYFVLFLPALAALFFLLPYYTASAQYKKDLIKGIFDTSQLLTIQFTFFFGIVYCLVFLVIIVRGLSLLYRKEFLANSISARLIVLIILISIVTISLLIAGTVFESFLIVKIAICCLSIGLAVMIVANYQIPHLYVQAQETIQDIKGQKNLLKGCSLESIRNNLKVKMEEEKFFLDDEITLESLAGAIGLNRHQLSQYLNQHLCMNFNTYLNYYRIREAEKFLKDDFERSAISVAYAVGFVNYMTFQKVFKKITGDTPSKYREKLPGKEK